MHLSLFQGIITTDGQYWVEQRRFALKHLKDFGFGKVGLEGVIQEEVEELVKQLTKLDSQDIRLLASRCSFFCTLTSSGWRHCLVSLSSIFFGVLLLVRDFNWKIQRSKE